MCVCVCATLYMRMFVSHEYDSQHKTKWYTQQFDYQFVFCSLTKICSQFTLIRPVRQRVSWARSQTTGQYSRVRKIYFYFPLKFYSNKSSAATAAASFCLSYVYILSWCPPSSCQFNLEFLLLFAVSKYVYGCTAYTLFSLSLSLVIHTLSPVSGHATWHQTHTHTPKYTHRSNWLNYEKYGSGR